MQRSDTYWPFTPDNSEEARIEAAFAYRSNIVAQAGQTEPNAPVQCVAARKAVIVRTPGDLYSESLADKFQQSFPGEKTVINFSQGSQPIGTPAGTQKATTPDRLASQVCEALKAGGHRRLLDRAGTGLHGLRQRHGRQRDLYREGPDRPRRQ